MGGLAAWATGGDFLQGAMQGLTIGIMNHMQHDPTNDIEVRKIISRHRFRTNPEYKKNVLAQIQEDGMLSFEEAFYWYQYGDGSDIIVDASKLELGRIDVTGKKVGEIWPIQTLSFSGKSSIGLVYGNINVEYLGNNSFRVWPDKYDFNIHTKNFFNWSTIRRNIETIGAKILHGTGTPFNIIFNGLYFNK